MVWGFSQGIHRRTAIRWLVCIILCGLTACGDSIFPPVQIPYAPCIPTVAATVAGGNINSTEVNIYKSIPNPTIVSLYQHGATPTPSITPMPLTPTATPDFFLPTVMALEQEQRTLETKNAAFQRLIYEVERWTSVQRVDFDQTSRAYLLVTFISPELVQTVSLNHILASNKTTANIWVDLNNAMYQFSKREELIFMVTVIIKNDTVPQASHKLEIDMKKMMLVNAENMSISPQHGDQNLDHPIDLTSAPVFGYLYYPMAVVDTTCKQVLDPKYNTKIVIQTRGVRVDSATADLSWTIPYRALLETGMSIYVPTFETPEPTHLANMQPLRDPPAGSDAVDWEEFAKFIWGQITLEIY